MKNRQKYYIVLSLILAFSAGWLTKVFFCDPAEKPVEVRADSSKYSFINPLLFYKNISDNELNRLQNNLNDYVDDQKEKNNALQISIYFRDMDSGSWTGVNEEETYVPASMLKVLFLMSYLKRTDSEPGILAHKLYYDAEDRDEASFARIESKIPSGFYSVNDLLNFMIINSDNAALKALGKYDNGNTDVLFDLFQLPTQSVESTSPDFMSVRQYSRIFRVLYDGGFLSWDLSEQALKMLSMTNYKEGLQKGVPEGVVVAHKFGERTNIDQYNKIVNYELHDCGIVYKKDSPYFICVMTRGNDFNKLQTIIQDISKMVYKYERGE